MKKLTLLLAAAMVLSGGVFAKEKSCCKKDAKCTKESSCCKDKKNCKKECSKDAKETKDKMTAPKPAS
jgi:hypothetical protein